MKKIKEQLVTFETAKLAKRKGFCNGTRIVYNQKGEPSQFDYTKREEYKNSESPNEYEIPTQSLLQRWLRENHNIHVDIYLNPLMDTRGKRKKGELYCVHLYYIDTQTTAKIVSETCSTYEEMLEIGLQKALELI